MNSFSECEMIDIICEIRNDNVQFFEDYSGRSISRLEEVVSEIECLENTSIDFTPYTNVQQFILRYKCNYFDFNRIKFMKGSLIINDYVNDVCDVNMMKNISKLSVSCTGDVLFDELTQLESLHIYRPTSRTIPLTFKYLCNLTYISSVPGTIIDLANYPGIETIDVTNVSLINISKCNYLTYVVLDNKTNVQEIVDLIEFTNQSHYLLIDVYIVMHGFDIRDPKLFETLSKDGKYYRIKFINCKLPKNTKNNNLL